MFLATIYRQSHWGLFCVFLIGCQPQTMEKPAAIAKPHEDLDATAWMQTSAEYAALCRQTYAAASHVLIKAKADPSWSALVDQQAKLTSGVDDGEQAKPCAVIMDLDETVLDNSAFQARSIIDNQEFTSDRWSQWVEEAQAGLVPGSAEFIRLAKANDIEVIFVTNRQLSDEPATRRNLESLGVLEENDQDTILSKGERDSWTSDKTNRRQFVATRYRVLLLVGDDLNDFAWAGFKPTAAARRIVSEKYVSNWGARWFLLPNANYGGWERSLYDFDDGMAYGEKLEHKRRQLELRHEKSNAQKKSGG